MANVELRFLDEYCNHIYSTIKLSKEIGKDGSDVITISIKSKKDEDECIFINLDKSTAIRFAKTIRTEIAKIKDNE